MSQLKAMVNELRDQQGEQTGDEGEGGGPDSSRMFVRVASFVVLCEARAVTAPWMRRRMSQRLARFALMKNSLFLLTKPRPKGRNKI